MGVKQRIFENGIYLNGLVLGFVLMGFEMLGSRYLNPYFGSGIVTWAALISTVLGALMVGYYLGGWLVDRNPRASVLASLLLVAAVYLFLIPAGATGGIELVLDYVGDGNFGVIVAAMALLFIPLVLLGTFSPFGVRLLLDKTERGGRVTGRVYGISTVGNVIGTLVTTLVLIPAIGTRTITLIFASIVVLCAISLFALDRQRPVVN